ARRSNRNRAPSPRPSPDSLRRKALPSGSRGREPDGGSAMGGESSSISLVPRRTRVVGIEGARQNAAHSFHGDATRQARAGQTLGVGSGRRFQHFTSAARPGYLQREARSPREPSRHRPISSTNPPDRSPRTPDGSP